ncbi:MAG TPA: glycosyltransferase family 2 protein [Chitinophaga sp.]|uniref:glycosyltransferase family 2 protein n=1 Tax=Chitinophaga sp. TaxID=1869181 RepID=UPI002DBC4F42|nr:glycosyltransferase family 2 protein [Chitinophaga sp.]HEU4552919.1 glycosyltransferase family 2 protein [Chitinophaga sp.]
MTQGTVAEQPTVFDVAVILLNYNSTDYTIGCIQSIQQHTARGLRWQLVIVDNASEEAQYHQLAAYVAGIDNIILVKSILNLGFSGGNMLGVQYARARYLYLLNNDTVFENDCLSILYNFMQQQPEAAICSGQMLDAEGQPIRTFGYFPTLSLKLLGSGLLRLFKPANFPRRGSVYIQPLQVPFVSGASLFIRYSMFADIGGLDTNYFFYCEEEDLAYTFRKKGWHCYLVPDARFVHFISKSTTVKAEFLQEYYFSLLYFFSKHFSAPAYHVLKWWYFFKLLKKCYKGGFYARIAWMIAKNAPPYYSLRFKQKIRMGHT